MKTGLIYYKAIAGMMPALMILLFSNNLHGQYPSNYQYTLLKKEIIDEIIGESSGDLAMKHLNGLAAYPRPRDKEEFPASFRESEYINGKLKEYSIKNHSVDVVGKSTSWRGIEGTIWELSPGNSKIADYSDIPEMLVEGSNNADVRAELVWVGEGQQSFFDNNRNNIKGKIVVTSGYPYSVHARAINSGACGTISFYSSRALEDPLQIPNAEITGEGFAFMLPPREGVLLRDRLLRREKIEVAVKVRSSIEPVDLLVPQCLIEGKDTAAGEIILTAHIFEGYVKMGGNDNMSGAAVILEAARLLNKLIESGRISRPERSIRFLWVPEFSGTIPWVNMNLAKVRKAVCNINLDMVGLRLRESRSFFQLYRSGHSTAHYVNDVMESYFRFTGETNTEGITDELGRRDFARRIVSPTGTADPFYYRIMSLHGSSDNAVFNDWSVNVPGIKLGTWPDYYYHSSEDLPDKCDPTQLRRAIFITAAGAYTIALGGGETAVAIISEMYSGATRRIGIQMARSSDMINKSDAAGMALNYRRAYYNIEGLVMAEKSALEKAVQISSRPDVITLINNSTSKLDNLMQLQLAALRDQMTGKCRLNGIPPVELRQDETERSAMKIVPVPTTRAMTMGFGGDNKYLAGVAKETINENPYRNIVNTDEVAGLADGKRNLLQIKKIVDSEFERETPLRDIINFYRVLKEAGLMNY